MTQMIKKPWGYELIWAYLPNGYVGKILHLEPQSSLSLQYHHQKDETMMLLSGEAYISLGQERQTLVEEMMVPNVPYHLKPGTIHRVRTGDQPADIVEVSTDHLDDVVRLEDSYGRIVKK